MRGDYLAIRVCLYSSTSQDADKPTTCRSSIALPWLHHQQPNPFKVYQRLHTCSKLADTIFFCAQGLFGQCVLTASSSYWLQPVTLCLPFQRGIQMSSPLRSCAFSRPPPAHLNTGFLFRNSHAFRGIFCVFPALEKKTYQRYLECVLVFLWQILRMI